MDQTVGWKRGDGIINDRHPAAADHPTGSEPGHATEEEGNEDEAGDTGMSKASDAGKSERLPGGSSAGANVRHAAKIVGTGSF